VLGGRAIEDGAMVGGDLGVGIAPVDGAEDDGDAATDIDAAVVIEALARIGGAEPDEHGRRLDVHGATAGQPADNGLAALLESLGSGGS
jgi:hypothetical protein